MDDLEITFDFDMDILDETRPTDNPPMGPDLEWDASDLWDDTQDRELLEAVDRMMVGYETTTDHDVGPPAPPVMPVMKEEQQPPVPPKPAMAFASLTDAELDEIEMGKDEVRTRYATTWGVKRIKAWCESRNMSPEIEKMPANDLAQLLRRFYGEARKQNGEEYSKSALCGIRASIHRFLTSAPISRKINIMRDTEFKNANNLLIGVLKSMKREQKDRTAHHKAIHPDDLTKLMRSEVMSMETPSGLQNRVWFNIQYYFCRRGGEGLRQLRKDSFEINTDPKGNRYVNLKYNEATKNHPGGFQDTKETNKKMFATNNQECPVAALLKYLSKLNPKCDALYQRPRTSVPENDNLWYTSVPVGQNKLRMMMKELSREAGLSHPYTNHCIRATCITQLTQSGFDNVTISRLSGHRNTSSITSYCTDASEEQKEAMSGALAHTLSCTTDVMSPVMSSSMPANVPARPVAFTDNSTMIRPLLEAERCTAFEPSPRPCPTPADVLGNGMLANCTVYGSINVYNNYSKSK